MADVMKANVCGRVVAMLSRKEDIPGDVVSDLVRAVSIADEPPLIIPKPVIPPHVCVAMIVFGILVTLITTRMIADRQ